MVLALIVMQVPWRLERLVPVPQAGGTVGPSHPPADGEPQGH